MESVAAKSARDLGLTAIVLSLSTTLGCAAPPNLELPTLGGLQVWADVAWADGWRVQRHVWTRHHRLLDPSNVRRAWGHEEHCRSALERSVERGPSETKHLVVLVHGLGRTRYSLRALREELEGRGHRVASISYPSTRASLDEHAASLGELLDGLHDVECVSFVTHSLGGRVVLRLLERDREWRRSVEPCRVVQIAPPNRGSELAARFLRVPLVGRLLGPSLRDLAQPVPVSPPRGVELGVLAGIRGTPRGWNPLLPGDDDGIVSLSETRPDGPHAHETVCGLHTFLMNDPTVLDATARFLAVGTFEPE